MIKKMIKKDVILIVSILLVSLMIVSCKKTYDSDVDTQEVDGAPQSEASLQQVPEEAAPPNEKRSEKNHDILQDWNWQGYCEDILPISTIASLCGYEGADLRWERSTGEYLACVLHNYDNGEETILSLDYNPFSPAKQWSRLSERSSPNIIQKSGVYMIEELREGRWYILTVEADPLKPKGTWKSVIYEKTLGGKGLHCTKEQSQELAVLLSEVSAND